MSFKALALSAKVSKATCRAVANDPDTESVRVAAVQSSLVVLRRCTEQYTVPTKGSTQAPRYKSSLEQISLFAEL